jgi:glycosyltransferase involved in cell wall biosynthesis
MPAGIDTFVLCGRDDGSVVESPLPDNAFHILKKLDQQLPFRDEDVTSDALKQIVDRLGPDLIHVHNILHPGLLDVLTTARPSIITVHDHRFFCPGPGKTTPEGLKCEKPLGLSCASCFEDEALFLRTLPLTRARLDTLSRFKAVVVSSQYMKRELIVAGVAEANINVIPPFVHGLDDVGDVIPAAFGRQILFAGRITWAKGIHDLLEAVSLADRRLRVMVAGAGPGGDLFQRHIHELKLADRVDWLGWVSRADLPALYRRARMVAMPARWQEPFGLAGLEAQTMARPVVAYDVGGISEWLDDGVSGILIPPGNSFALASALNVLFKDPRTATQLGFAGQDAVRSRFQKETAIGRLTDLYYETI